MMPRPLVVHCNRARYDVYIGRPSKWGNPFSHRSGTLAAHRVRSVAEAIAKYREWVQSQPQLMAALPGLRGKTLGCWCKKRGDEPCHGDVLIELIGGLDV